MERLKPVDASIDVLTYEGSGHIDQHPQGGHKEETDLFIAVAHYEDTNISAAILAKKLGARKVIARIDNMEYLERNNKDSSAKWG